MKWSLKIGTVAGIGVYIHATFLLLIGWVAVSYYLTHNTLAGSLQGIGFILALFGCVLLHEFGHALTAQRYGIKTRDITLLPIGGVARLEKMPDKPVQEFWVALAGPAVNVVIAIGLFVWLQATGTLQPLLNLNVTSGSLLMRLLAVNLSLAIFNLVPAFPMDGGRVVRALLAMRLEYTRATQIAALLGQGLAFVFGFIGLFTNPFLMFIALFVWIGAAQEASMVQMKSALGGIPVGRAMLTEFHVLSPNDPLSKVVGLILSGTQHDFPVVENEAVVGILTQKDMLLGLAQRGQDTPVSQVMQHEFQVTDLGEMLEPAFARLQSCQCRTMPVLQHGQLVGLLTMENVTELLMIQSALEKARQRIGRISFSQ